jgi:hypothetical protein
MELFGTKNTKNSKRVFNESQAISEILSGKTFESQALQESAVLTEEIKRDSMFALAHNGKERQRRIQSMEKQRFNEENKQGLIEHFLFNVINEALLLDKDVKSMNKEYMTAQVKGVVGHLVQGGKFNGVQSMTLQNVMESIDYHIDAMFKFKEDASQVEVIRKSYMGDVQGYVGYVSEAVKDKVAEVLKTEKQFSTLVNESEEEFKGNDTLFRTIQLENVKLAIKEEEATEVNEAVMSRAFAESLFDYTLLETLNTLQIIQLDEEQIRNGLSRFFKGTSSLNEEKKGGNRVRLHSLKIPKGTEEVAFEIFFEGNVMAYFMQGNSEVGPAVGVSFTSKAKDVEKEFKQVVTEFKEQFRGTRLSSKNPGVKFTFSYHDKPSSKVKL